QINNISRGGYILYENSSSPDMIIISTGSELRIALDVSKLLNSIGYSIRVVSMISTDVFDQQDLSYKEIVLPSMITKRIAIEAGVKDFWYKYVGLRGLIIGMDTFGESAPAEELFNKFGFNVKDIVKKIKLFF
ncbi:MAG TPA: transketolase C-terminal domain-containing protein, partial [Buchnera sp. (in: enterobacteria)]|nr:transketolase C-terminal domain-containing protein [Buchnera sp. (in: enterobacteria)]